MLPPLPEPCSYNGDLPAYLDKMICSPDSRRSLTIAVQYYQTGELSQVEQICFSILEQQPNQVEALQLLGIIACKAGLLKEGIAHYQKVIALRPDLVEIYYNLGKALKQQGIEQADSLNKESHASKRVGL